MTTTNHYLKTRQLGLAGRVISERFQPLRMSGHTPVVSMGNFIIPIVINADAGTIDADISNGKASASVAKVPRNEEGGKDYKALDAKFPQVMSPWTSAELVGITTKGPQPKAKSKSKSKAKAKRTSTAKPKADAPADPVEAALTTIGSMNDEQRAELVGRLAAA